MLSRCHSKIFRYIIAGSILFVLALGGLFPTAVRGEETGRVSSFEELCQWIDEHITTGGIVTLTDNITVPEDESYTYLNAIYRKEIIIRPEGYTIYVEGTLELWPYLSVHGAGGEEGVFCVRSGGTLLLTSISIDTGSEENTAVLQENGAVLKYGEDTALGLPEFSCVGKIVSAEKITVSAVSAYSYEKIPVVTVPEGTACTPRMLPEYVTAYVWENGEEVLTELPVTWNTAELPERGSRGEVTGRFGETYEAYRSGNPLCLVVTASESRPYFLHCYASEYGGSTTLVFYAVLPGEGEYWLCGSDNGEDWTRIEKSGEQLETGEVSWLISYLDGEQPFHYYAVSRDQGGEILYSDILEFTENSVFAAADIDGGRGGETSPVEGENLFPGAGETGDANETGTNDGAGDANGTGTAGSAGDSEEQLQSNTLSGQGTEADTRASDDPSYALTDDSSYAPSGDSFYVPPDDSSDVSSDKLSDVPSGSSEHLQGNGAAQIAAGLLVVAVVLAGAVAAAVRFFRK
ncbi:hypothetical protein B5F07_11160 [Lachnoclostridium sp. An169]|uniref:hypothetical protein n=1 Tax=Lachnoclostridium sp. An169 TaxID=1965569 RepID=UPI000B382E07|nr:hypothetical protein [Lachnoclostridium sp. An169]OUP83234.1 hypothetical protein B5F07_11160 [Lachnoclostridium sp. An169]HJA67802.1 hypothetical protein [Candidatus Mediterraneibacter cottocaccae]